MQCRYICAIVVLVSCAPTPGAHSDDLRPQGSVADTNGPYATRTAEYRFAAAVDPTVLADRPTELWAVVHMPDPLPAGPAPLLVFLHGNHGTCGHGTNPRVDDRADYTSTGQCPAGYVVTPNHRGYDYLGDALARWGYIVVSVNANLGITSALGPSDDWGLNLARGRLLLRHMGVLSQWNAHAGQTPSSLGVDLAGKLDFSQVGLMGHSRGGEGVRAAWQQYIDAGSTWPATFASPLTVQAMLEIGPVDGQTSRTLTPTGVRWGIVAPGCDGDVSNLAGLNVFERALANGNGDSTPKMAVAVWGANHNFFNSEWQTSDEDPTNCPVTNPIFVDPADHAGSAKEREAGTMAAVTFFRAFVGQSMAPQLAQIWNSDFTLADVANQLTRFERAFEYHPDPSGSVAVNPSDDVRGYVGSGVIVSATTVRGRAAVLLQPSNSTGTVDIALPTGATSAAALFPSVAIDLRAMRAASAPITSPLSVSAQLLDVAGTTLGRVALTDYIELGAGQSGIVLGTARIWLSDFAAEAPSIDSVATLRLSFDTATDAGLVVSSVRLIDASIMPSPVPNPPSPARPVHVVEPLARIHNATMDANGNITSNTPFGFRADLHKLYVNGAPIANAGVGIGVDGASATLIGADGIDPTTFEIRYGDSERWIVQSASK